MTNVKYSGSSSVLQLFCCVAVLFSLPEYRQHCLHSVSFPLGILPQCQQSRGLSTTSCSAFPRGGWCPGIPPAAHPTLGYCSSLPHGCSSPEAVPNHLFISDLLVLSPPGDPAQTQTQEEFQSMGQYFTVRVTQYWVAQRGCGVSVPRDTQKPSGQGAGQLTGGGSPWAKEEDQVPRIGSFHPQPCSDPWRAVWGWTFTVWLDGKGPGLERNTAFTQKSSPHPVTSSLTVKRSPGSSSGAPQAPPLLFSGAIDWSRAGNTLPEYLNLIVWASIQIYLAGSLFSAPVQQKSSFSLHQGMKSQCCSRQPGPCWPDFHLLSLHFVAFTRSVMLDYIRPSAVVRELKYGS